MNAHIFTMLSVVLFIVLLVIMVIGRAIGERNLNEDKSVSAGIGHVESAIFTLLGLLIAFTFYGASQRFDVRREMIVNEANAIGTAWLRVDLLPVKYQPEIRKLFAEYTQARLSMNQTLPDIKGALKQLYIGKGLQTKIWSVAMEAVKEPNSNITGVVVIPALNQMFDIENAHNLSLITHPPLAIYLTLLILLCISALFIGISLAGSKRALWVHGVGYALIMVGTLYVVCDYEFPRIGYISLAKYDAPMIELNQTISNQ
jgi:hypothetical protein